MNAEEQKFNQKIQDELDKINSNASTFEDTIVLEEEKKRILLKKILFPHYVYLLQYMDSDDAYRLLNYFKGFRRLNDDTNFLFFYGKKNSGKTTVIKYVLDKLEDCYTFEYTDEHCCPVFEIFKISDGRGNECIDNCDHFQCDNTF
mgnify:CR=1 FL=1